MTNSPKSTSESGPIRVLLADDHPVVRSGIRSMLEQSPGLYVVGEVADGEAALAMVETLQPQVLVIDMEMPGLNGVDVARRLRAIGSPVRILALSAYDDERYIFGLLGAGASGYLTKDEAPAVIVDAVRGIARGEEGWLSRRIMAKVVKRQSLAGPAAPLRPISPRERQVLQLLAQGATNEQIGAVLGVSEGTIRNHVSNLYAKLEVRTRAEAVAWAWQHGLMNSTPSAGLST